MLLRRRGSTNVFARHDPPRRGDAARGRGWGLEIAVRRSARAFAGADRGADARRATTPTRFRKIVLEHFDMSLGTGLGKVAGKVFRIGHLGDFNDLMLWARWPASRWAWILPRFRTAAAACWRPWTS